MAHLCNGEFGDCDAIKVVSCGQYVCFAVAKHGRLPPDNVQHLNI
jgi:hypothetical protein